MAELRKCFYSIILLFLTLSLVPMTPLYAQLTLADLSVRITDVDPTNFPQVTLNVIVRDANGVPVPDLDASAFEVNEDRAPQARPIVDLTTKVNPDLPAMLVLLIDISGSMEGSPLVDAQTAARELINQLGTEDEVALIAFADAVNLDEYDETREHEATAERDAVIALVDTLKAGGGTPLYDALYKGVGWASEATLGQRAVILLTDGVDDDPGSLVAGPETPILAATRANVPIFTIGLGNKIDRGYLERVARLTGGTYQETPDSAQLTDLFLNVLDELKQQYVLRYTSGLMPDGQVHRVQVHAEVGNRQASDEADLPLAPGRAPTLTPLPTVTPTPVLPTPTPTSVPVSPVISFTRRTWGGAWGLLRRLWAAILNLIRLIWNWVITSGWRILLGVLALVLIILLLLWLIRAMKRRQPSRQEYCEICHRPLKPNQICPDCGADAGRFTWDH